MGPAVADHLARRATTPEELVRALAWDPANPALHLGLASAYESRLEPGDLDRAWQHLQAALRLRPTHGASWLQLALLAERRGLRERAERALETAVRLDPHNVWLRWEAALLALRWGEREQTLGHLRYVLAVDPKRRGAAFQLARTLLPPGEPLTGLLPSEPDPLTGLLRAALEYRDLVLAQTAWERRAVLPPALDENLQRRYLELLLEQGQGTAARRLWLAMTPQGHPSTAQDAVWNGDFEAERLLGWGLDWRVQRVWGVDVALDRFVAAAGEQSLRLSFTSFSTLDFSGVHQIVPVRSGAEYRLRARAKALGLATQSGVKLEVVTPDGEQVLARTSAVAGTTPEWVSLEGALRVPDGVTMVHVRVRREPAAEPEGNLGGKVWLDEVSLIPVLRDASPLPRRARGSG